MMGALLSAMRAVQQSPLKVKRLVLVVSGREDVALVNFTPAFVDRLCWGLLPLLGQLRRFGFRLNRRLLPLI